MQFILHSYRKCFISSIFFNNNHDVLSILNRIIITLLTPTPSPHHRCNKQHQNIYLWIHFSQIDCGLLTSKQTICFQIMSYNYMYKISCTATIQSEFTRSGLRSLASIVQLSFTYKTLALLTLDRQYTILCKRSSSNFTMKQTIIFNGNFFHSSFIFENLFLYS